jgi:hypothetical protein
VIADSTPPVITPTVTGTLGNHGWYTSNVHVTWSVTDPESAITNQSGCGASDVTVDTAGVTFTCSATSSGGTDSNSVTIKRDASAPSITASPSPAANANGWNKTDVTVSYNCTDNGPSGVDNAASDLANDVLSASGTASGTCVDNAGNSASASYTAKIDKLAPNAPTAHRTPDANLAGWNNSNVTVSFTDSGDNGDSGIDSCTSSSTLMIETSGTDVSGTCTDKAGNVSPQATVTVKIDKTKPVVTGSRNIPANANGWNNTPVAVSFSCADAGAVQSGIATDTVTGQTVNSEVADLTVTNTGSCVDVAHGTSVAWTQWVRLEQCTRDCQLH